MKSLPDITQHFQKGNTIDRALLFIRRCPTANAYKWCMWYVKRIINSQSHSVAEL